MRLKRIRPLRQHAAGHDHIGPIEVGIGQLFGIAIDQAAFPGSGQHRGNSDQAERGARRLGAEQLAGIDKIPERAPIEAGHHQEDVLLLWHSQSLSMARV